MGTTTISARKFRAEANRRLIDSFELMNMLGLRSRQTIWQRVDRGTLPAPVIMRERRFALWDRDEITTTTTTRQKG